MDRETDMHDRTSANYNMFPTEMLFVLRSSIIHVHHR